jgi:outer membrane usher protein
MLVRADGTVPEVGTLAHLDGSELTAMVGYDGVLFVEGLRGQNRVRVGSGTDICEVRFDYTPVAGELPVIGPLVCQPLQGE